MVTFLRKIRSNEQGISALEYALLAGMILVVVGGVLTTQDVSGSLSTIFTSVSTDLSTAASN
ncbi:MAG: hypothetical protein VR70_08560 [Rhodospirillaceae bacterium BRH_c57]|nr:MAG: hypothetical protein VR70_08560 [Rhodospirillaceae bacterium BRH_c57]